MKIKTISKIYKNCKVKNPSKKRYLSDNYVLWNIMIKYITFLPAFYLNKLKVSPDFISLLSFIFIPLGSFFIIINEAMIGAFCWIIFGALDSLDGDMARLSKRKTFYGETLDSLGADIFYFLSPVTVGYYLFNLNNDQILFNKNYILITSFLITFFLISIRYLGSKRYILSLINPKQNQKFYTKNNINNLTKLKSNISFIENEVLRGNLFAEPGMLLNYFILFALNQNRILELYLILIFIYYFTLFFKNTIAAAIYFKNI